MVNSSSQEKKKRTSYYLTKTLLDRYDSPTNSPINQQQQPMTPGQKITSMTTPVVDSSSPRRGRSTSPKLTSRDSSSDPETLNEKYDGYDDEIAVSEKKGSHHRTDDNDSDDDL
ncbi:12580_t:CDS:2 [Entrophospora sp. SA101]|nr:12580_t:CDS:2 [Entrophospora sp. SA101]